MAVTRTLLVLLFAFVLIVHSLKRDSASDSTSLLNELLKSSFAGKLPSFVQRLHVPNRIKKRDYTRNIIKLKGQFLRQPCAIVKRTYSET